MLKCAECKKRKHLLLSCKCEIKFCIICLNNHKCDFDHKGAQKRKLTKELNKIKPDKVPKI